MTSMKDRTTIKVSKESRIKIHKAAVLFGITMEELLVELVNEKLIKEGALEIVESAGAKKK
jgi:hypothetical protein